MDLKTYYDAATSAEAKVKEVAQEIDAHFTAGETEQAVAMRPALEDAKAKAKEANDLYLSMRDVPAESKVEKLFVPANPEVSQNVPGKAKEMTREAFEDLSMYEKRDFMKAGGQLIEAVQ